MPIINDTDAVSPKANQSVVDFSANLTKSVAEAKKLVNSLGEIDKSFAKSNGIKKNREATDKLTASEKEYQKILKQVEQANLKLETSQTRQAQKLATLRVKQQEQNKVLRQNAKESIGLSGAYDRLTKELNEARTAYKNLAASGTASTKQLRAQQQVVNNLDTRVKKIDAGVGQFQRNVGNYPRLLGSATGALKNFAAAFGLIGGIQLFARVVQDTFKRIRDFDKELVNLAAVAGKTRPQIKSLEKEILAVSGSSINTANQVAQLATELIKLGSTDEEAKKLLKPINDFSIALRASAEESASFLKGVLNAFGVGAEEAGRFGDVLSKAANRSALDFQKLTESFGFVAPTARQLGIPVERLAAQIGTLTDNNIKASRAGRLLNTSFARLVSRGLTLDDALNEIRGSTDKVKTATELFGAESFTIGLILADNEEKVNSLTKEFENSQGTLDDLTKKQLASLDSQLNILDSTWEEFILGMENGQGVISKTATFFVDLAKGILQTFINLEKITSSDYLTFWEKTQAVIKRTIPVINNFIDLNKGLANNLKLIDDTISSVLDGVNQEFQFGFRGLEPEEIKAQIDNIKFFEKEIVKNLLDLNFPFEDATRIAATWRENTILEFKNVAKATKEELQGVGETVTEVIGNAFAKSLDALSKGGLDKFLESLKEDQAELVREFDRIGGSITKVDDMTAAQKNLKDEIEEVEKKISIVNNAIAVLGKEGVDSVNQLARNIKLDFEGINKEIEEGQLKSIEKQKSAFEKAMDARVEAYKEGLRLQEEAEAESQRVKEEIINQSLNLLSEIYRGFADLRIQQISDELNAIQHKRDREIDAVNRLAENEVITEEQKEARLAAIDARFDAKERQLKQQQARAEKQAALFQIAINTAVGIASALKTPALIPFIIALGAAQAAFVAAQPLPKFKEGSKGKKVTGLGQWGEEGTEMAIDGKGNLRFSPPKPTVTHFDNEEIVPHDLTMKILAGSLARSIRRDSVSESFQDERIVSTLEKTSKNVVRAINKKPVPTRDGYITNGTRVKQLNFWRGL